MDDKRDTCCAADEQALYDQVAQVIERYRDKPGSLIMVLHAAQEIFGYLPTKLQQFIADGMDIPLSEVCGVISFYSFFSTQKRGKHTIPFYRTGGGLHNSGYDFEQGTFPCAVKAKDAQPLTFIHGKRNISQCPELGKIQLALEKFYYVLFQIIYLFLVQVKHHTDVFQNYRGFTQNRSHPFIISAG